MLKVFMVVALAASFIGAAAQAAGSVITSGDPLRDLVTYGTALGATLALGAVKKYTTVADTWVGRVTKPIQPWLVLGLTAALPALIHGTPNVPDAAALAQAPVATLLAVGAAEIFRRFVRQPAPFAASVESRGGIGVGR